MSLSSRVSTGVCDQCQCLHKESNRTRYIVMPASLQSSHLSLRMCLCMFCYIMQCYSGASNGITKNFETVQDFLKDFVTIRDASKAPSATVSSLSDATGSYASVLWSASASTQHVMCIAAFCTCQEGRAQWCYCKRSSSAHRSSPALVDGGHGQALCQEL